MTLERASLTGLRVLKLTGDDFYLGNPFRFQDLHSAGCQARTQEPLATGCAGRRQPPAWAVLSQKLLMSVIQITPHSNLKRACAVVDRLRALRGPGESYSDVILRLAADAERR